MGKEQEVSDTRSDLNKYDSQTLKIRRQVSVVLDDEANAAQIRHVSVDAGRHADAIMDAWSEYLVIKTALNADNDISSRSSLSPRDFLAGVQAGIVRLPDDAPKPVKRRSYDWLWSWGIQPFATATALVLLVLIGVGVSVGGISNDAGYTSINKSAREAQYLALSRSANPALQMVVFDKTSLPTFVGDPTKHKWLVQVKGGSNTALGPVIDRVRAHRQQHTGQGVASHVRPFVKMVGTKEQ